MTYLAKTKLGRAPVVVPFNQRGEVRYAAKTGRPSGYFILEWPDIIGGVIVDVTFPHDQTQDMLHDLKDMECMVLQSSLIVLQVKARMTEDDRLEFRMHILWGNEVSWFRKDMPRWVNVTIPTDDGSHWLITGYGRHTVGVFDELGGPFHGG